MAWALQFGGAGYKATFSTWTATGDFNVSGRFVYVNATEIVIGDNSKASEFVACISGGVVRARVGNVNSNISGFTAGDIVDFEVERVGSTVSFTIGATTNNFTETDPFSLNAFGVYNSDSLNFSGQIRGVFTLNRAGDVRAYDIDASNHGAGTVTITDTSSAQDATGVNFPTDGSAWINLGGGVTSPPWWVFQEDIIIY